MDCIKQPKPEELTNAYYLLGHRLKEVAVVDFEKVIDIPDRLLKKIYPQRCFHNALVLAQNIAGCEYVEGEAVLDMGWSTIHAWNRVGELYIDVTWQLYNDRKANYFPVIVGSLAEIKSRGYRFGMGVDVVTQWLNDRHRKYLYIDK